MVSLLFTGVYEGVLWKKGKDNGQFLKRKFVLSEQDFTLKYYKEDVSTQYALLSNFLKPNCLHLFIYKSYIYDLLFSVVLTEASVE